MRKYRQYRQYNQIYGPEDYAELDTHLEKLRSEVTGRLTERLKETSQDNLSLLWNRSYTYEHDEDAECVPDHYPTIAIRLFLENNEAVIVKVFPYTIVIARYRMHMIDEHRIWVGENNYLQKHLESEPLASIIVRLLVA